MTRTIPRALSIVTLCLVLTSCIGVADAAPRSGAIKVGWATTDITPDKPVALSGQAHTRISKEHKDRVTATALAVEVVDKSGTIDQVVIVSCDVVAVRGGVMTKTRDKLRAAGKTPGLDIAKTIFCATHTHTAPVVTNLRRPPLGEPNAKPKIKYAIPKEGVIQVDEYVEWMTDRLTDIVTEAWTERKPAGVSWCLGHAVVGYNRRVVYKDGEAKMYGDVRTPRFLRIEGPVDHDVDLLYFWDDAGKLTGVAINVPCPSQAIEGKRNLSADFWHDTRCQLWEVYGKDLFVLPMCGASGDISPHPLIRKRSEAAQWKRCGVTQVEEIGRRITATVVAMHDAAKGDIRKQVPLGHLVETIQLPPRKVTQAEAERSKARIKAITKGRPVRELPEGRREKVRREEHAIKMYEHPYDGTYSIEAHVLRLGDVAIATNPFELFTEFGLAMKARSPAEQTLSVQLSCGSSYYLPTKRAVAGGGYSAEPAQNIVGPEGGHVLVDRTVELITKLWKKGK